MNQIVRFVIELETGHKGEEGLDGGGIENVENLYDPHALADSAETIEVIIDGESKCVFQIKENARMPASWYERKAKDAMEKP